MKLPDLQHDYAHSLITRIAFGPRREVTLSIQILEWAGQSGGPSPARSLRFGGIANFEEATTFFARHSTLELASLHYSATHHSKPGSFFIELHSDRTNDKLTIHCRSVQVS